MAAVCPVCGCTQGNLLYRVTAAQSAQHFVLQQADAGKFEALRQHIETLWGQKECAIVRCRNCAFVYSNPFVGGDARFYELAFSGEGYPTWKWEYTVTVDVLKTLAPDFTLLEVGAGNGAFVKAIAPALTSKSQVVCTEYSSLGREAIRAYGITVLDADLRAMPAGEYEHFFDVICMFQVLEHLDRMHELFASINQLTRPGASFFAAVPNGAHIEFNELNDALLDMPPNHIGRWNKTCFEILAAQYGWRVSLHRIELDESFKRAALRFGIYRYLYKSQESSSIANRIERVRAKRLRRPLQAAAIAGYALGTPQLFFQLYQSHGGGSQWVHWVKQSVH